MTDDEIIKEVIECVPTTNPYDWAEKNLPLFIPKEGGTSVEIIGYEIPIYLH